MPTTVVESTVVAPSTSVLDSYTLTEPKTPARHSGDYFEVALDALSSWHNESHAGQFDHCYEQPCHAVRQAVHGG